MLVLLLVRTTGLAALLSLLMGWPGTAQDTGPKGPENGFVGDRQCAVCHAAINESFQTLGMSRSFSKPKNAKIIEDFDAPRVRDGRLTYQMTREGEDLIFAQWQTDQDGQPIHRWQRRVDWIVGSGSTSRVYLVQSRDGSLYELPAAWYTQEGGWGIKPGASETASEAGLRQVTRGCMFCHNAIPSEPAVNDHRFAAQVFPETLPEGIGCQRCHGPGGAHVAVATEAQTLTRTKTVASTVAPVEKRMLRDRIRSTILDPSDLSPERRRDVCAQCHHQPAVELFGQRRLDKRDFEFVAGDVLDDFLLKLEVEEFKADGSRRPQSARFQINHHAYRLEQSACFKESAAGALECTSCHDPHLKPDRAVTLARTRTTCLGCHQAAEESAETKREEASFSAEQHFANQDCVSCHLPRRRTQDVVHVVMTDHWIRRSVEPAEVRLAMVPERQLGAIEVRKLDRSEERATPFDNLVIGAAGIRVGSTSPVPSLEREIRDVLAVFPTADLVEPTMRLGEAYLHQGRLEEARAVLEPMLATTEVAQQAREWLAVVAVRERRIDDAIALLDTAIEHAAGVGASHLLHNRGLFKHAVGDPGACADTKESVELDEFRSLAWYQLGRCHSDSGAHAAAAGAYGTAIGLDPNLELAATALATTLDALGRKDEARRVMQHHGTDQP